MPFITLVMLLLSSADLFDDRRVHVDDKSSKKCHFFARILENDARIVTFAAQNIWSHHLTETEGVKNETFVSENRNTRRQTVRKTDRQAGRRLHRRIILLSDLPDKQLKQVLPKWSRTPDRWEVAGKTI